MEELAELFQLLDLQQLRVRKPSKTVFLCGGQRSEAQGRPLSFRDYLLRLRAIFRNIDGNVVLAEDANQLYRDSRFRDLISFEEAVAQVAAVILIIAESPGSLAELGAFTMSPAISPHLKIIVNQSYEQDESFIRFGPLRRLENDYDGSVAFYPWRIFQNTGMPSRRSLDEIYGDVSETIRAYVDGAASTSAYTDDLDSSAFYLVYWIVLRGIAVKQQSIIEACQACSPELTEECIVNAIYVLKMVKWIDSSVYGPYRYFYTKFDRDSLQYAFINDGNHHDGTRFSSDVSGIIRRHVAAPEAIIRFALEQRA